MTLLFFYSARYEKRSKVALAKKEKGLWGRDYQRERGETYFWALIWNLTPRGLDVSSTYS